MEAVAITGGVTTLTVAVLFWLLARTLLSSERRASHWEVEAIVARAQATTAEKRATYAETALERRDAAYALLNTQYTKLATAAMSSAPDAEAVVLAGGDPGPSGGDALVGRAGDRGQLSDGLLSPDWSDSTGTLP